MTWLGLIALVWLGCGFYVYIQIARETRYQQASRSSKHQLGIPWVWLIFGVWVIPLGAFAWFSVRHNMHFKEAKERYLNMIGQLDPGNNSEYFHQHKAEMKSIMRSLLKYFQGRGCYCSNIDEHYLAYTLFVVGALEMQLEVVTSPTGSNPSEFRFSYKNFRAPTPPDTQYVVTYRGRIQAASLAELRTEIEARKHTFLE